MEKFMLQVELRYGTVPKKEYHPEHVCEYTTIGVYDTFQEAIKEGNRVLNEIISKHSLSVRDGFGEHNGPFRSATTLVTNCCTHERVQYFAQITPLKFLDLDERIKFAFESQRKHDEWKRNNNE